MLLVSPSPTPQDEDDHGLSITQIAAIVIGVSVGTLLLVIISVLVGYCLGMHHKSGRFSFKKGAQKHSGSNVENLYQLEHSLQGSVHSMKPKFTDVDSKKKENYEEGDKGKKSLDKSEEAHI